MEEIFIYLGYSCQTYFFMHTQFNPDLSKKTVIVMSGQIYNCMIHDQMIKFNDKVVVYNIMKNNKHIAVIIDHDTFQPMEYPVNLLENMLIRLIAIERNHSNFCIKTDGSKYEMYEFNESLPTRHLAKTDVHIDKIKYLICTKEINYLN